jgi:hypothetical protein
MKHHDGIRHYVSCKTLLNWRKILEVTCPPAFSKGPPVREVQLQAQAGKRGSPG